MNVDLKNKTPEEIQELVDLLAHDPIYGCWTRPALEFIVWPQVRARAKFLVMADLDWLHQLNDSVGEYEVNRRVREAMQVRDSDVAAAGRWFSGDELIWILCDPLNDAGDGRGEINPRKAAQRLQDAFGHFGLSATFGISRILSYDLGENVKPAHDEIKLAKTRNRRGSINQTGSLAGKLLRIGL